MLRLIANINSSSVTEDVKASFITFGSQRCPKIPRLTQGLFQAALWSRGWLKQPVAAPVSAGPAVALKVGMGEAAVNHWAQRQGSWWDSESQGLWYVPFLSAMSVPLEKCAYYPRSCLHWDDPNLKWSICSQEGFCAKTPTQPQHAWLVLLTASRCFEMLKQITQGLHVLWWILCLELMWDTWVQHSLLFSHLLIWVCIPSSELHSPVRSSADSSSPCTDTAHARGALSAWLQCLLTGTAPQLEKGLPGTTLVFYVHIFYVERYIPQSE